MDDDEPVGPAVELAVRSRAVHRTVGAFGQASDELPSVLLKGPLLELTGHLVGLRQPGDKTQPGPGHLLEVLAGDQSRIGHIQQLHGVQKALLDLPDDLQVPLLVAGVAVVDRCQQRQTFLGDHKAVDELLEVWPVILAVAVGDVQQGAVVVKAGTKMALPQFRCSFEA